MSFRICEVTSSFICYVHIGYRLSHGWLDGVSAVRQHRCGRYRSAVAGGGNQIGASRNATDRAARAAFLIFNYGLVKNWKLVFQGQNQFPLANSGESASITGAGAFLKGVLREGNLQDASGSSIAVEFGPPPAGPSCGQWFRRELWHDPVASAGTRGRCTPTSSSPNSRASIASSVLWAASSRDPQSGTHGPVAEFFYQEERNPTAYRQQRTEEDSHIKTMNSIIAIAHTFDQSQGLAHIPH
jgi:hypothetical protein